MKNALAITLALVLLAGASYAGTVSPGLEALMSDMKGGDEIKVLVVMNDQADIESLNWELHDAKASFEVRHDTVLRTLRDAAARSQQPLLDELDGLRGQGKVRGYTPHWLINAVVVSTTVDEIPRLAARPDVDVVEPDLVVELIGPVGEPRAKAAGAKGIGIAPGVVDVGARRVWDELGIDGTGALVGVLDTGVQESHTALNHNYRGNNGYPDGECWIDAAGLGDATPIDQHYHGTHVMGTICGQADDDTIGVAPGAQWIASNVINMSSGTAFDNAVIASLEFMTDPDGDPGTTDDVPDVVQNSWGVNEGFTGYYDCDSRWWDAIDNCEAAGVVLTWSAGNEGSSSGTLRSPADRAASIYNTFSVGSTNHTAPYSVSDFSSRGPSGCGGDYAMKPEIMAPGDDIYSADPDGGYQYLSGTSMAGPHIAGVVALMRAANPGLDVVTIKQILMDTAIDLGVAGEDNDYGHGFVDAYEAVLQVMSGYGTLEGTVTDLSTTLPIEGATVTFTAAGELPRVRTTDASGFYSLMLPQGDWDLDVTAFGYLGATATAVAVLEDATTTQDFDLAQAPSALLSGYVYDDEAAPVDGATIIVLDTPLAAVTSGVDGYYEITMPTGAVYDVLASAYGMGSQQVNLDFQGATTQDFVLPQLIFENYESGTLVVFPWETSGEADWFTTTDEVYEGTYSAKSGGITHNEASVLSITLDVLAAGNVEFYYKVSSESSYDYLTFTIDGGQQDTWSGEIDWTLASYPVDAGEHTFAWTYDKDGSVDTGGDCAWIDYVVFPTIAPPTYPELAVSPPELSETLPPGGTSVQYITLDNNGEGELLYTASVYMDPPTKAAPVEPVELGKDDPDPRPGRSPLLGSGGPDAYGYSWVDSDEFGGPVYDWVEISGLGTALSLSDDALSADLPMGITFKYYDDQFTTVKVCSNGFLTFTSLEDTYNNDPIPTADEPNNLIAPYWDDLNPASGGTVYYYADTANARFIVQWDGVVHYGTSDPQTFQVILHEDKTILFQYAATNGQEESTVGIENAAGDDGLEVAFNAAYIQDGLAVLFSFEPPPEPWLSVTPGSGTVPGLTAGTQLQVDFNATDLPEGTYTGHVTIGSNDPDNAQVVVPVTLVVTTTSAVDDEIPPRTFALGAAYPNPFNPSTKIAYSVPADGGRVDLKIFDLSGRLVRTLVSGDRPAGHHTALWTGQDDTGRRVASGTYFYRLQAPGFDETKKMVLVK